MRDITRSLWLSLCVASALWGCAQGATPDYSDLGGGDSPEVLSPDNPAKVPELLGDVGAPDPPVDQGGVDPTPDQGPAPDLAPDLPPEPDLPLEPDLPPEPDLPEEEINTGPTDRDNDSWFSDVDCDDNDPTVWPNGPEACGDFVDNNCDGLIDEGCDSPQAGEDAASCGQDSDCGPGRLCLQGWPGNYCTQLCNGAPCQPGSVCLLLNTNNGQYPLCFRSCLGDGDCRPEQACVPTDNGDVCGPACTQDRDCQSGRCDPVTGLCQ